MSRGLTNEPFIVYEDGLQTRNFVHVADVAEEKMLSLEKDDANFQAREVGSGADTPVLHGVIRDPQRRSTRKTRLMSLEHGQQVFRLDEESPHWVSGGVEEALLGHIRAKMAGADAVLCSDYWKGTLTARILQTAFHHARQLDLPAVVAPKDSSPEKYRGAGVLIPNMKELAQLARAAPDRTQWLGRAAIEIIKTLEIESLLATRGSEGISLFERSADAVRRVDIPTTARTVYDVTGAGDTVVSVFTLAVAAGVDRETAARWANAAGGIVVGKRGTACVTVEELQEGLQEEKKVVPVPEGVAPISTLRE